MGSVLNIFGPERTEIEKSIARRIAIEVAEIDALVNLEYQPEDDAIFELQTLLSKSMPNGKVQIRTEKKGEDRLVSSVVVFDPEKGKAITIKPQLGKVIFQDA